MLQNISPTMDGTVVAIGVSLIICVVWTLIAPEKDGNYDAYKTIQLEDCEDLPSETEDPMAMNKALKVQLIAPLSIVHALAEGVNRPEEHDFASWKA